MISFDIPDPSSIEIVSDWIELNVILEKESISKAAISAKIEGDSGDEPTDAFISNIWDEMNKRMTLYGIHPPFITEPDEITPNLVWEDNPEYLMCLILALTGNPSNPTPAGKLFERISKDAIKNYLNGEAVVFGHPSQYTVSQLCELTNEGFKRELPANYNDRGLDVLAWKPFGDNRGNQIIIMMQCAGGANWTSKTGDVVLRAWTEKYITFGCFPTRGFSTAVTISEKEIFEEVSFETNLLFDRPRLIKNLIGQPVEGELRNEILDWCNHRLAEILN